MIQAGDRVPSVSVKLVAAEATSDVDTATLLGEGRIVLFGVPGAFTPTCDTSHLPGFIAAASKIKGLGVSKILCATANDHFVVRAWGERSEAFPQIEFIADPYARLADAMGLSADKPDLGGKRYTRFAMIVNNGAVEQIFVQDVAGVTVSGAPAILLALQSVMA